MTTPSSARAVPALSVVIPLRNESGNIAALLGEIVKALRDRVDLEIICVDDASEDATGDVLRGLADELPLLRVLVHDQRAGQSAAVRHGVKAARAPWVVTLDGDGQNDPADLPGLLAVRDDADAQLKLVVGWRVRRRDRWSKRVASRVASLIRRSMLHDATPDTGCGIKLFEREAFLDLPYFDHMHRYLPALMQRAGWRTVSVPVNHRARVSGASNYTNLGRAWVGLFDLCGVAWLIRRSSVVTVHAASSATDTAPSARTFGSIP